MAVWSVPRRPPHCWRCQERTQGLRRLPRNPDRPEDEADYVWLCLLCQEWQHKQHAGKVRFNDPDLAHEAAAFMRAQHVEPFTAYRCPWCSYGKQGRGYHVGRVRRSRPPSSAFRRKAS